MKINGTFILHEISGDYILVPTGTNNGSFHGICALNETGAFIWKQLRNAESEDAVLDAVTERYNVGRERAKTDVEAFLARLSSINIIERSADI